MVEDFTQLSAVKFEPRVGEVDECDARSEQNQPRVVAVAARVKWIITHLVSEGLVVQVVLLLE